MYRDDPSGRPPGPVATGGASLADDALAGAVDVTPPETVEAWREAARKRRVLILRNGTDPETFGAFCEPHIETMDNPKRARSAVVGRDDAAHCIECDYHAPACPSDCPARYGLEAYEADIAARAESLISDAAMEAENRWQNGRRDPESWRERGQEADGEAAWNAHMAALISAPSDRDPVTGMPRVEPVDASARTYVVEWTHGDGMDQHQHFVEASPDQASQIRTRLSDLHAVNPSVYEVSAEPLDEVLDAITEDLADDVDEDEDQVPPDIDREGLPEFNGTLTGWGSVRSAADRAVRDPRPDPADPRLPCPSLELELDQAARVYEEDPISEFAPSECFRDHLDGTLKRHVAAHGCRGLGVAD